MKRLINWIKRLLKNEPELKGDFVTGLRHKSTLPGMYQADISFMEQEDQLNISMNSGSGSGENEIIENGMIEPFEIYAESIEEFKEFMRDWRISSARYTDKDGNVHEISKEDLDKIWEGKSARREVATNKPLPYFIDENGQIIVTG